jgi:hypothetical protein
MKALTWIAWISAGIGILFMLFGGLCYRFVNVFNFNQGLSYFQIANSFFLLTIALFIFLYRCQCKKE